MQIICQYSADKAGIPIPDPVALMCSLCAFWSHVSNVTQDGFFALNLGLISSLILSHLTLFFFTPVCESKTETNKIIYI